MGPGAGLNLNIFPNLLIIGNHLQIIEPLDRRFDGAQLVWDDHRRRAGRNQYDADAHAGGLPGVRRTGRPRQLRRGAARDGHPGDGVDRHLPWRRYGQRNDRHRGVVTGPVTHEHHIRGYFQEWARLMTGATTGWSESRGNCGMSTDTRPVDDLSAAVHVRRPAFLRHREGRRRGMGESRSDDRRAGQHRLSSSFYFSKTG